MEALFFSAVVVAIAEIGDKTQLLAIILAARFRKPLPIIGGILAATILNHGLAATAGYFLARWLSGPVFQYVVGVAFILMAAWALVPDKADDDDVKSTRGFGVFITTLVAFFLVEIGDKTQVATTLLAARYQQIVLVTVGTTAGMMLANVPAVYLGEAAVKVFPLKAIRTAAAVLFAVMGVWIIAAAALSR
ncbi:TMEM165/GDT1 family protein [Phenylobacterium immobile]|uniref:TMEM165/GDT1 family protein n=1 Tax=Phenylobacterium immobile TaxID=21 RepID=UPI000B855C79|nr:TMEM165/GDT1 family protein [Phenylobacterium immobile]